MDRQVRETETERESERESVCVCVHAGRDVPAEAWAGRARMNVGTECVPQALYS